MDHSKLCVCVNVCMGRCLEIIKGARNVGAQTRFILDALSQENYYHSITFR